MIAAPYVQFIDHLIYTAPTLEEGMDRIEHLLGVRPVPGGRHPNFGTHNSLLSIGEGTYLEVIAPDPELPNPPRGRWLAEFFKGKPRLATWVRKATDIQAMRDVAISHDIHLGEIEQGERKTPEGDTLTWQLSDPYVLPFDGALPFLINWGHTTHPSSRAPSGGTLLNLRVTHPQSSSVRTALLKLGMDMDVQQGNEPTLRAEVEIGDVIIVVE